jgi:hypothetical protein
MPHYPPKIPQRLVGIEPGTRRCLPIIGQFLLVCCHLRPLKTKCLPLHTVLEHLQPTFFPLCEGPNQTHKTTRKVIFLYILTFIFLVTNGKIKYWGENTSRPPWMFLLWIWLIFLSHSWKNDPLIVTSETKSYRKLLSGYFVFILHFTIILLHKLLTFLLPSVASVINRSGP